MPDGGVPLADPVAGTVSVLAADNDMAAVKLSGFNTCLSKKPALEPFALQFMTQSGLMPVMTRASSSALAVSVAVEPLTERVIAPASTARERSSALPALVTRDVVAPTLGGAASCWSGRS